MMFSSPSSQLLRSLLQPKKGKKMVKVSTGFPKVSARFRGGFQAKNIEFEAKNEKAVKNGKRVCISENIFMKNSRFFKWAMGELASLLFALFLTALFQRMTIPLSGDCTRIFTMRLSV